MPTDHLKVLIVAGVRPNFVAVAPIFRALTAAGLQPILLHTGQHYDPAMSALFFNELGIPEPEHNLHVGAGSHAAQTARMMEKLEPVLVKAHPHWVLAVGDTNSALAAALVAAKLRDATHARVAHVQAGLRSNDWRMPEEINRLLTDRISDLLLTPSEEASANLLAEGIPSSRIRFVGNVAIDSLFARLPAARATNTVERLGLRRRNYAVTTLHRPSNVDESHALAVILEGLALVADSVPVVLPLHPRTRRNIERFHLHHMLAPLTILDPLGYTEMLALTEGAQCVLTDSGGIQEETTALGVPCVTLREQTERPVTLTEGTNRLAHWPLTARGIQAAYLDSIAAVQSHGARKPAGWDGHAAERIVQALKEGR